MSEITASVLAALQDCDRFTFYWWKPKAMAKLLAAGLVDRVPTADRGEQLAYRINAAGRAKLREVRP